MPSDGSHAQQVETASDSLVVTNAGPVRTLTFNQPQRRNAFDLESRRVLLAALRDANSDPDCRAIVLTGAGGFFSAGGDIRSMTSDPEVAKERLDLLGGIARALITSTKPVISAIEGGAFGMGLSLVAASDYSVASDAASFAASFGKLGLIGDTGVFWSLPRKVGVARARELLLFASRIDAHQARALGLVSEVVPAGEALEVAHRKATGAAELAPGVVARTKRVLAAQHQDLESLLTAEAQCQMDLLAGEDFQEGQRAFFERRPAVFTGR